MAPKTVPRASIIIIDVSDDERIDDKKKSFFEKARDCATCIIERKIICQENYLLGVILLGSNTKNNLAPKSDGDYKHIEVLSELDTPTWNMIRSIPEKPTNKKGDWVEAITVAAEQFMSHSGHKIINKSIVLMTDFKTPTKMNTKCVKLILDGLKENNIEVCIIGPNLDDESVKNDKKIAELFIDCTDGKTADFDYTMDYLSFHQKRAINPTAWNVDLSIGPNIKIPVSSYLRLKDDPIIKKWQLAVKDSTTSTSSTTESAQKVKDFVNPENKSTVDASETIKGYNYGQSIISMDDTDKDMLYVSGPRCLTVYGFTDYRNVDWQSINSEGLSYVFGRKGDKNSQKTLRCLVECLHELNLVIIARKVHNNNNAPRMVVLFPVIDTDNYICLSMASLCYKDDIKYMSFPNIGSKKYACTDKQVNAFKDLIKAMDLTRAYDEEIYGDTEAFPVAKTFSPFAQYVLDCIAFRAMNPGKPLPQPRENIKALFNVPPQLKENAREPLQKLKSMFVLNKVEKKQKRKKITVDSTSLDVPIDSSIDGNTIPKIHLPQKASDDLHHISTVDPISDFTEFYSKGETLADLSPGMTSAIENLFYTNLDDTYTKALDAMSFFRKECVKSDPCHYNNWLQKFRVALNVRSKNDVLELINNSNLNVIIKEENSLSSYETEHNHNDTQMYENDTIPNSMELTMPTNDTFDEL